MSPKRLKNGLKPSLFPVQISKIFPRSFWRPQSAAPKPLPRLFLDPSYGPEAPNDTCIIGYDQVQTRLILCTLPFFLKLQNSPHV